MKKVLLVATVQSHICQFHRPLAELLHDNGYEIHVAARNNLAEKNGLKLDFAEKVFDLPFSRSPKSPDNIKAYKGLKKILAEESYDVIHCNTPMGGIVARLAAKKTRKKGTKVFYTAHGFHFYKGASKKNWMVYYPIEKLFARKTDKLIAIVGEDYETAKNSFNCPVYRIHGVGVNEERYTPVSPEEKSKLRREMGFDEGDKILLCIGELLSNKNQQMVIRVIPEILKKYPNTKLLLAGNGPEKENLEALIASLGLEKSIIMLGYVTNLQDYQHISDILVACSKREGLGLNVIEAQMSGNPCVLTDNRGHRELIDEGRNGYLVKVNDYKAMTDSILAILDDPEKAKEFSRNGLEFSQQYNFASVKKELEGIYELRSRKI